MGEINTLATGATKFKWILQKQCLAIFHHFLRTRVLELNPQKNEIVEEKGVRRKNYDKEWFNIVESNELDWRSEKKCLQLKSYFAFNSSLLSRSTAFIKFLLHLGPLKLTLHRHWWGCSIKSPVSSSVFLRAQQLSVLLSSSSLVFPVGIPHILSRLARGGWKLKSRLSALTCPVPMYVWFSSRQTDRYWISSFPPLDDMGWPMKRCGRRTNFPLLTRVCYNFSSSARQNCVPRSVIDE